MSEWWQIYQMAVASTLFAVGGTRGKYWRRYVLPLAIIVPYTPSWSVLGYVLGLSVALHMGYGERCSWIRRVMIFSGYSLPCLFFGWSWWIVLTPILCSLLFLLSNSRPTASVFLWKGCECAYGLLIAITVISGGGRLGMQ